MARILVLTGISGGGKSTYAPLLSDLYPNLATMLRVTTRVPRPGEVSGRDYEFVTEEEFQYLKDSGQLLFGVPTYGAQYGIRRRPVEEALARGQDVFFETVVRAAAELMERPECRIAFLRTPDEAEQINRLRKRGMAESELISRLAETREELAWLKSIKSDRVREVVNWTDQQTSVLAEIERYFDLR